MKALVKVTGPHRGAATVNGKPRAAWRVAVFSTEDDRPASTVYRCLSYRRAVALSCSMARDRRLFLHLEALPH